MKLAGQLIMKNDPFKLKGMRLPFESSSFRVNLSKP